MGMAGFCDNLYETCNYPYVLNYIVLNYTYVDCNKSVRFLRAKNTKICFLDSQMAGLVIARQYKKL